MAKSRKRKLPKVLSRREAEEMLRRADDGSPVAARNVLILTLMYRAGLRVSEVVALKPRDVEPDGVVKVYDGKGGDGTAYFTPDLVIPALDRYMETRTAWLDGEALDRPLIVNPSGSVVTTRYVQRLVSSLKRQVGIAGICTPHVFRHTFATEAIEDGFPLHEVQRLMRHANIATTEVYLHVRDESLRAKMSRRSTTEKGGTSL